MLLTSRNTDLCTVCVHVKPATPFLIAISGFVHTIYMYMHSIECETAVFHFNHFCFQYQISSLRLRSNVSCNRKQLVEASWQIKFKINSQTDKILKVYTNKHIILAIAISAQKKKKRQIQFCTKYGISIFLKREETKKKQQRKQH